jgi:hypothetical protein
MLPELVISLTVVVVFSLSIVFFLVVASLLRRL